MAWTEVKVATLSPQMLFQLGQNPTNEQNLKAKPPMARHSSPTVPKRAPFCSCWQEWQFVSDLSRLPGHTDFQWICAPALPTHFWKSPLCPGSEAAPAAKPEHATCLTSVDLPPAAGGFPREGQALQWQHFTDTQHIWILLQVCHRLLGDIQPPGASRFPSAE